MRVLNQKKENKKMKMVLNGILPWSVTTILIYIGIVQKMEGYENIAIYFLYFFGLGLFITIFFKKKKKSVEVGKITNLLFSAWFLIIVFTFLFYEYYLLATLYFVPFLSIKLRD